MWCVFCLICPLLRPRIFLCILMEADGAWWRVDWKSLFRDKLLGEFSLVTHLCPLIRGPIKHHAGEITALVASDHGFAVRYHLYSSTSHTVYFYDTDIRLFKEITILSKTENPRMLSLGGCYVLCISDIARIYSIDGEELAQYPCPDASETVSLTEYTGDMWDDDTVVLSPVNDVLQELRWDTQAQKIDDSVTYTVSPFSGPVTQSYIIAADDAHVVACDYLTGWIYCWERGHGSTVLWQLYTAQGSESMTLSIAGGYVFYVSNQAGSVMNIRDVRSGAEIGVASLIGHPMISRTTRVLLSQARQTGDYSQIQPVLFYSTRMSCYSLPSLKPKWFDFQSLTVVHDTKRLMRLPQDSMATVNLCYFDGIAIAVNTHLITIVDLEHQRVICKIPNRDPARRVPIVSVSPDRSLIVVRHGREEVEICEPQFGPVPKWMGV